MDKIIDMLTWIAQNWINLVAVVLTFGFMIFIHEMGHFLMAKRVGITVHEFALGFGPKLLQFGGKKEEDEEGEPDGETIKALVTGDAGGSDDKKEAAAKDETSSGETPDADIKESAKTEDDSQKEPVETRYCLRAVPFGGFVSMEGEDDPGDPDDPGNFNNKSPWDRLKVIVAGCTMNYITGLTLLLLVGFIWGIATPNPPPIVGAVLEGNGYPLQNVDVKPGDKIVQVNDTKIRDFYQLSKIISPIKDGRQITIFVERKGKITPYKVNVKYDEKYDRGMLGFAPQQGFVGFRFEKRPAGVIVVESFKTTWRLTIMPVIIVQKLMAKEVTTKQLKEGTAGPIGISQMIFDISKEGLPSLLYMCAILSILIGAFNLIPFPALDGARALFLGVELVRKKPIDPAKEGMVHQLGFIVLIILVLLVSYNDVIRLIKGASILK